MDTVITIGVGAMFFVTLAVIGLSLGLVLRKKSIKKSCGAELCEHEFSDHKCHCGGREEGGL